MKTVAIIQARMGSTRLPNKVMMKVLDKPLLKLMVQRIGQAKNIDQVIVATTKNARDDVIANLCVKEKIDYYRGDEDDVLSRYYFSANKNKADVIVRLTADCPLVDPTDIDLMLETFIESGDLDFYSNSEPLPSTWADGTDISIFTMKALEEAHTNAGLPSEREHVTFYFWNKKNKFRIKKLDIDPPEDNIRITLDYPEDFELIEKIINKLSNGIDINHITRKEIMSYVEESRLVNINNKYKRGQGWIKSFEKDKLMANDK